MCQAVPLEQKASQSQDALSLELLVMLCDTKSVQEDHRHRTASETSQPLPWPFSKETHLSSFMERVDET